MNRVGPIGPFLLCLLLLAQSPGAASQIPESPGDPTEGVVVPAGSAGAWGGVGVGPQGTSYLAWSQCDDPGQEGCNDVWLRSFDVGTKEWSPAKEVYDGTLNAALVQVFPTGSGAGLAWVEGSSSGQAVAAVVHCFVALDADACGPVTPLSTPGIPAGNLAGAVGEDGRLRLAWQEESVAGAPSIVLRVEGENGWGQAVVFPTGSQNQGPPAVTVGADGSAHVAWEERVPGQADLVRRFKHAEVASGSAVPGPVDDLGHIDTFRHRVGLATLADGTIGAAYGTDFDVFYRELHPGSDEWSDPVNVSRANRRMLPLSMSVLPEPDGGVAISWEGGTISMFHIMLVRREAGFWLAPERLVGEPFEQRMLAPTTGMAPDGTVHVGWTGTGPQSSGNAFHYLVRPSAGPTGAAEPGAEPLLFSLSPEPASWTASAVDLRATVFATSAVDQSGVAAWLDGVALPVELGSDGSVQGRLEGLADGVHELELEVTDRLGLQGQAVWTFGVDSTAPTLSLGIHAGEAETEQTSGWLGAAVSFHPTTPEDEGSPTRIQFSAAQSGLWTDLATAPLADWGLTNQTGRLVLEEGIQPLVRFRAVDAAGNVALGPELHLGWDAHAPELSVPDTQWVRPSGNLSIRDNAPLGSPVLVNASFSPAGLANGTTLHVDADLGALRVPMLASGSHDVVLVATDLAGNAATPRQARIVVDASTPLLRVEGGQAIAADADSGLSSLKAMLGDSTVAMTDGGGAASLQLALPWKSAIPAGARLVAEDRAGNVATLTLGQPVADPGGDGSPLAVNQEGGQKPAGSANMAVMLMAGLAALALLGRRS